MGKAKEIAQLNNRSAQRQYNYDMKQFAAQKADLERETELTNKVQEATFEYQQEMRNIQRLSILDQYEKSNDQYEQQLVWNEQAAKAARESQDRVFEERIGGLKEDYQNQKTEMQRTNRTAQYNLDQQNFSLQQALYNSDQKLDRTELDFKNSQLAIGAERSNQQKVDEALAGQKINIENRERDAIVDRNFEQLAAEIDFINTQGAQLARGRRGKSATAGMQVNAAVFAINTAKISDALYRSEESLNLERQEVNQEIRANRRSKKLTNKSEKLNIKGQRLNIKENIKEKTFARKGARIDIKKLTDDLELDLKVFTQNKEKLGASLINAAESREYAMGEIARGKVQADISADAARMLPPRFAPDPPRPYEAEMPTLVPPPEPIQVTREAYQVPQPKKQSGLSKVLAIGGAVLGIAGAAFTGGASLAGAGTFLGMSAATAGSVGVGMTTASGGLGLISQYTR